MFFPTTTENSATPARASILVIIVTAIVALSLLVGCIGVTRTREYLPTQGRCIPLMDGWMLRPDIYAYKNVTGADAENWWQFVHEFRFSKIRTVTKSSLGDITVAEVDTLSLQFTEPKMTIIIPVSSRNFVSGCSYDQIVYRASYHCNDSIPCFVTYPKTARSVLLRMRVLMFAGTHSLTYFPDGDCYLD